MKIDRIYSRKRIRLPRFEFYRGHSNIRSINEIKNSKNKAKNRKMIIIIAVAALVAVNTIKAIDPILETLCISEAKNIATDISNVETSKVMEKYTYSDLSTVEKDSNGKIRYIKSNISCINQIVSDISEKVQKALQEQDDSKLYIRLGSFFGIKMLAGRGPKVEITMSSIGDIETNIRSELSSAGINQTLHKIILDLRCNVAILTPYKEIDTSIDNQIILAEDIIIGEIPSTYYNIDGIETKDTMELIE